MSFSVWARGDSNTANNASLMWALIYCAMLYLVAYGMYRRKWFLKF